MIKINLEDIVMDKLEKQIHIRDLAIDGLTEIIKEAYIVISKGIDLMPDEHLGEWQGVRAWIETTGEYLHECKNESRTSCFP